MRRNVFMPVFLYSISKRGPHLRTYDFYIIWIMFCILWMYTHKQKFVFGFGWFCVILYFRLLKVIENIRLGIFIQIPKNDKIRFFSSSLYKWWIAKQDKTSIHLAMKIYVYFCISTSVYNISRNIWIETWYNIRFLQKK